MENCCCYCETIDGKLLLQIGIAKIVVAKVMLKNCECKWCCNIIDAKILIGIIDAKKANIKLLMEIVDSKNVDAECRCKNVDYRTLMDSC
jgi:hypothetical protein